MPPLSTPGVNGHDPKATSALARPLTLRLPAPAPFPAPTPSVHPGRARSPLRNRMPPLGTLPPPSSHHLPPFTSADPHPWVPPARGPRIAAPPPASCGCPSSRSPQPPNPFPVDRTSPRPLLNPCPATTSKFHLEPPPTRPILSSLHRGVEQLVARRAHNPEVGGSNPSPAIDL